MILSDTRILEEIEKGTIKVVPYQRDCLGSNSYDVHLGKTLAARYKGLVNECQNAYNLEVKEEKNFYSKYADTNLQEFWAESVELFFEKPKDLNHHYPNVFKAMTLLLNQDPRNKRSPLTQNRLPIQAKLKELIALSIFKRS